MMKNIVISFCLGFLLALGIGFADFEISPDAPIHTMNKALLKANIDELVKASEKLLDKCYNARGQFNAASCKTALETFKIHLYNVSENLYCPSC